MDARDWCRPTTAGWVGLSEAGHGGSGSDVLRVVDLHKAYRDVPVLANLDVEVASGEIVAVVGPNGAGKSTLLECLAGATRVDQGSIAIHGETSDPSSAAHWRAVFGILDDFTWLPDLTVADHLMLLSDGDVTSARQALEHFDVGSVHDRTPESLSSGQRQRASLATAHVRPWQVLLLDEPEGHLDAVGVTLLARELVAMATQGRCILLSTHSSALVAELGCRVLAMSAPGRV